MEDAAEGEDSVLTTMTDMVNWLVRALMALAGIVLILQGLPVARGALQAQKADATVVKLRTHRTLTLDEVTAGIAALGKAIEANPTAGRYLLRSELEGGAALTPELHAPDQQVFAWLRSARADLEIGLANAPARSIDWLRLAAMREALDGPSRDVIRLLNMSIRTGPWLLPVWPTRLRLILDNWAYYDDQQKSEVQAYVVDMWRHTDDRRFFAWTVHDPVDELIIRSLLRGEPGAQEVMTQWLLQYRKT